MFMPHSMSTLRDYYIYVRMLYAYCIQYFFILKCFLVFININFDTVCSLMRFNIKQQISIRARVLLVERIILTIEIESYTCTYYTRQVM